MFHSRFFNRSIKKYRVLVLLIGVFLALNVLLLIFSFFATRYFTNHALIIDASTRQGVLVQQMSKNLMDTDLYLREAMAASATADGRVALNTLPQEMLYRIGEIKQYRNQFEQALEALQQGGEIKLPNETAAHIDKQLSQDPDVRKHVEKLNVYWTPYLGLLDNYLQDIGAGYINAKTSNYLVEYTRLYNQSLLTETEHLTQILHGQIADETAVWERVQLAGIVLAFALFGLIVFGALRRLAESDELLEIANREMGEIMSSVREGLFLVNKDFEIGHEYSARLEEILGQKDIGGKNFLDVIAGIVPESELETTRIFVEQLYSDWVVEDLIEDLNPLHRITFIPENESTPKYLDFKFFRVTNNGVIERILVNVVDSTETVMLQSSLEAQKEQEKRELEMLNTILNTDGMVLENFIRVSKERLEEINTALKSPETGQMELKTKVNYIGRGIHSIKGEASALHLSRMVDICETVEDTLAMLRRQSSLSGQDFLGMVVLLEDLYRLVDILDNYSERLNRSQNKEILNAKQTAHSANTPASVQFAHAQALHLQRFVSDIAERSGKKVTLSVQGFDQEHGVTGKQWQAVQDIAMQILRNAVIHGIESPEVRQERKKPETGRLKLSISEDKDKQHLMLVAEDDGNGIDFEAIRAKAVQSGQYSAEQAAQLNKNQLLMMMLGDGFSTLDEATEDAGKGVGMGIIKETVHGMGGKMNIATAQHQYTRFSIKFPKAKQ
ncbi:ATP-binding protein [Conchiformibius steedae DSM 2580]|uniref:Chemotaxis protein CheA n=1 Tax=Conchiformibius steedae DSM 2580 TaxID=1121352 RepID=A0AAE9HUS2_9NEIS|nr:ATP-binding protein [Conchiformibius steedae]QMT33312.1 Hpt domain-containing protein [Conchiformibius steedae]URD67954.1 ATP-binding protein [Conchiformibius steedae DSM 2580]